MQTNLGDNRKKRTTRLIVGAIAFFVTFTLVQQFFFGPPTIDAALTKQASEMNKNLPMMIDHDTRADNIMVLPGKTVRYNYTLVNLSYDEVNLDDFESTLKPWIVNTAKTSPDVANFRKNDVTMEYNYVDKNGTFVYKITVTPDMYK